MTLTFNDYEEICREVFEYLVDLSREFVKQAKQQPELSERKQYEQYQQQLAGLGSEAMVEMFFDKYKGPGEGARYVKAMNKVGEKLRKDTNADAMANGPAGPSEALPLRQPEGPPIG